MNSATPGSKYLCLKVPWESWCGGYTQGREASAESMYGSATTTHLYIQTSFAKACTYSIDGYAAFGSTHESAYDHVRLTHHAVHPHGFQIIRSTIHTHLGNQSQGRQLVVAHVFQSLIRLLPSLPLGDLFVEVIKT